MNYEKFKEAFENHAKDREKFDFKIVNIDIIDNGDLAVAKVSYKWELNGHIKNVNTEWYGYTKDGRIVVYP